VAGVCESAYGQLPQRSWSTPFRGRLTGLAIAFALVAKQARVRHSPGLSLWTSRSTGRQAFWRCCNAGNAVARLDTSAHHAPFTPIGNRQASRLSPFSLGGGSVAALGRHVVRSGFATARCLGVVTARGSQAARTQEESPTPVASETQGWHIGPLRGVGSAALGRDDRAIRAVPDRWLTLRVAGSVGHAECL
jgi:hypothetical protein